MRELDSRAQTLMKTIDEKADEFMKTLVKEKESIPEDVRKDKLKTIQDMFNRAKEYGDDKVQLAIQTYELVDKHIRRLDSDLARFEGEIQDKTLTAHSKSEETVGKRESNVILIEFRFLTAIPSMSKQVVGNEPKTQNHPSRRNGPPAGLVIPVARHQFHRPKMKHGLKRVKHQNLVKSRR